MKRRSNHKQNQMILAVVSEKKRMPSTHKPQDSDCKYWVQAIYFSRCMLKRVSFCLQFFHHHSRALASNTAKEKREISLSTQQTPQKAYKNFRHLQMETEPFNTEKKLSLSFILFYGGIVRHLTQSFWRSKQQKKWISISFARSGLERDYRALLSRNLLVDQWNSGRIIHIARKFRKK